MSTRAIIAWGKDNGFVGRYHHSDGYPQGLGATLFDLYRGFFKGDMHVMKRVLFDEHPAGWSSINGADFSLAPGWTSLQNRERLPDGSFDYSGPRRPACYCHGDRHETQNDIRTERSLYKTDCAWVYIFTEGLAMQVYKILNRKSGHSELRLAGDVYLNGPEPDWEAMEEQTMETITNGYSK